MTSAFPEHDLHIGTPVRPGENTTIEQAKARRLVARRAHGLEDCALLLDALGLVPPGMQLTVEVVLP